MVKKYYNLFILLFITGVTLAQSTTIISWNIKDFGQSRDDQEILAIAQVLKDADIVAIQEVVAKHPGGAQAVARLVAQLNRMGSNWDYKISNPTKSPSAYISERYAFLWKKHKAKLIGRAHLIDELAGSIHREPYLATFKINNTMVTLLNYHACTHKKNYPERYEIGAITNWIIDHPNKMNFIWMGDMNIKYNDISFQNCYANGFRPTLTGEKTSLKRTCKNGNYLSRAEDNILYNLSIFDIDDFKVLDFIAKGNCEDVSWKRNSYSDHLPIQITIGAKH